MAHAGQFGDHYAQVADRFFHALEWRYNDIVNRAGHERESEILARLLDVVLADQVAHDYDLQTMENALRHFQKIRHNSFTPNKYRELMFYFELDEDSTRGYTPQLFGNVTLDVRRSI